MAEEKKEDVKPEAGKVVKVKKKVAIVGCSESRDMAPFKDESFEIWGVNNLYSLIPRASRWFEIHLIENDGSKFMRRGSVDFRGQKVDDYLAGLAEFAEKHKCPIYMQQKWDSLPTSEVYPIDAMVKKYGSYFTNSVSYMLAMAIEEGFDEIHVYGVDMAVSSEYHHQRPSCEFFLGVAAGMGKKIYIPAEADLLKTRFLYGFQETENFAWTKKMRSLRAGVQKKRLKAENKMKQAEAHMHQFIGAEQMVEEAIKIWE